MAVTDQYAELSGSVSEKDKTFIETWENVGLGTNYVIRENRRGDEVYEQVAGKRKFKLSTWDRMLTEDKIADDRHNPFKNGSFRPILVPEDVTIETNPNAMSDDDVKRLFQASDLAWAEWMEQIDSPATLQRMLDMADNGEADLAHRRYKQLSSMHARYSNIGQRVGAQKDQEMFDRMSSGATSGSLSEPTAAAAKRGPGRPRKEAS